MKLFPGLEKYKEMTPEAKKEFSQTATAFIVLLAATIFGIYNFILLNRASDDKALGDISIPLVQQPSKSKTDIEGLEEKYNVYLMSRNFSGQLVMLAEAVGRYPIANASAMFAEQAVTEYEVPDVVPVITIKALVLLEGLGVATLDIEGERPGQIVRKGYVFGGGKGKITGIDAGGVSWKWSNTQNRTNL